MRFRAILVGVALFGVAWGDLPPNQQLAADRYRELLLEKPLHASALERLWRIYSAAGETDQLIAAAAAESESSPRERVLAARILLRAGQPENAEKLLGAGDDLDLPEASYILAQARSALRRHSSAAEAYLASATGPDPRENAARLSLAAQEFARARKPSDAMLAWSRSVDLNEPSPSQALDLASLLTANEGIAEAFEVLESAAAGGAPEARLALLEKKVELARKTRDLDAAIGAAEDQLTLLGPDHWKREKAEAELIQLHKQAGTLDRLRRSWQEELLQSPKDPGRIRRLARLARAEHLAAEEADLLERLLEVTPTDKSAMDRMIVLQVRLGDWEKAAAALDRMRRTAPNDPELLIWRAIVAVKLGEEQEAQRLINEHFLAGETPDYERALEFYRTNGLDTALIATLALQLQNDPQALDAAIELATLRLQNGEVEAALELLEETAPPDPTPEARSAWFSRISETLGRFDLEDASLYWARRAAEANPQDETTLITLSDKLVERGLHDQARSQLETIIESTESPETRSLADRRLHALLQTAPAPAPQAPESTGWIQNLATRNQAPGTRPGTSSAVREYLAQLREKTLGADSMTPYLRLAEWLDLSGETNGAVNTLQRGLDKIPDSREARLRLIELHIREGMLTDAADELESLIEQVPESERLDFRRRLARLQLERGDHEPALAVLRDLVDDDPTASDRHIDLAIALQATDRWFEALQSWKEAYSTAAPARRTEIIRSMLPVFDRIGAHSDAERFLFSAAEAETNPDRKLEIYQAAARYEIDHRRIDEAKALLSELPPDEANSLGARAAKIALEPTGSRQRELLLADLAQEGGRAAELAAEIAGASGENELAAEVRADKVLAGESASPSAWAELATSREQAGDVDAAAEVWQQAINIHSQDRNLLGNAAEFFRRHGRWRDELRALRQYPHSSEASPERWLRTAVLEDRAGNLNATTEAAKQVIYSTGALNENSLAIAATFPHDRKRESANLAFRIAKGFHDQETLGISRALTQSPDDKDTTAMRVEALRLLAKASGSDESLSDIELSNTDRALLSLEKGEPEIALESLSSSIESETPTGIPQFNWLLAAFAAEDYLAIREWLLGEPEHRPAKSELFNLALSLSLSNSSPDETKLAEGLAIPLASSQQGIGWRLAHLLADHGYYRAAARAGLRAFNESRVLREPERAILLGKWLTLSDERQAARRVLSDVADQGSHGLYDPAVEASRLLWRISNHEEKAELLASLEDSSPTGNPGIRLAQAALWNEMAGKPEAADDAIQAWVTFAALANSRVTSDGNGFAQRVRTSIDELEDFGLGRLALSLADAASQQDTLSLLTAGEIDREWPRELRAMQLRLAIQLASSEEGEFLVRNLAPEEADVPHLKNVLRILSERGHLHVSLLLAQQLMEVEPGDLPTRQIAVHLARKLGDQELAAELLNEWYVQMEAARTDREQLASIQRQLISTYREAGRLDQALALVDPRDEMPLDRSDQLLRNELLAASGKYSELEEHLRDRVRRGNSLLGGEKIELAEFLSETGREQETLELTEDLPSLNEIVTQSAMIARLRAALLTDQVEEIDRLLGNLTRIGDPTRIRMVAQLLDEAGQRERIPSVLAEAISQNKSAGDLIYISSLLFDLYAQEASSALLVETLRSVIAASESSERNLTYFSTSMGEMPEHAADPSLDQLLASNWREGKGAPWIGSLLAHRLAREGRPQAASKVITELLTARDIDPEDLSQLAARLEDDGEHALSEPLWERILETRRNHLAPLVRTAQNLWLQGKRSQALDTLREARMAPLWLSEAALEVARFYVSVGRPETASRYLELGGEYDAFQTEHLIRSQIAEAYAEQGRFDELETELQRPGEKSLPAFGSAAADLLLARGGLQTTDSAAAPFELAGPGLTAFRVRAADRFIEIGRPDLAYPWLMVAATAPYQSEVLEPLSRLTPQPHQKLGEIWEAVLAVDQRRESRGLASDFYLSWSERTRDPARKLRLLERSLELAPSNLEAALKLASLLLEVGDRTAAATVLQETDHTKLTIPERR